MANFSYFKYSIVVLCIACYFSVSAQPESSYPFQNGQTICFLGNSITQSGYYHSFIKLFYQTRFPDANIRTVNCGTDGNQTWQAIARLENDVLIHNPDVVVMMLGMNDVGSTIYSENPSPEDLQKQHEVIKDYQKNMDSLSYLLQQKGIDIVYQTPSIYDQTASIETKNYFGKNDALAKCREIVLQLAEKLAPVVDYFSIMQEVNQQKQQQDPAFTVVGEDRVHPEEPGHLLMAYQFIKTFWSKTIISQLTISASTMEVTKELNCATSSLQGDEESIAFVSTAFSLPFPVADFETCSWVPLQEDINRELLTIEGLSPGSYQLKIDDELIALFSAAQLTAGINLANHANTPQYKQALLVRQLNEQYNHLERERIRVLSFFENGWMPGFPQRVDLDSVAAFFQQGLKKVEGKGYYSYIKSQTDDYLRFKPLQEKTLQELERISNVIQLVNQPVAHKYEVVKIK